MGSHHANQQSQDVTLDSCYPKRPNSVGLTGKKKMTMEIKAEGAAENDNSALEEANFKNAEEDRVSRESYGGW